MLKKRIIPCLDIMEGRTVKGVNFEGLRDAGDPVELALRYVAEGADELVFLDIKASQEGRETTLALVKRIAACVNIPFTVGGGISDYRHAAKLIESGADKVSVNSAAVRRPELISEIASSFGSQCVVVAVDTKRCHGANYVFTHGGSVKTDIETMHWVRTAVNSGAGELLLTSMDRDGTKSGFDLEILDEISSQVKVPVIASGGAGSSSHFLNVFTHTGVDAALAASLFHFGELQIPDLKAYLKEHKIDVRWI